MINSRGWGCTGYCRKLSTPIPAAHRHHRSWAGDVLRAILNNTRYPATLLDGVMMRIRAEQKVTRGRAAIIKAYYLRNEDPRCPKEVLTVENNKETNYQPYVMGQLFAVLEAIQMAVNPDINTTIKDRYFNAAAPRPATVFPTILMLAQKAYAKMKQSAKDLLR